VVFEDPEKHTSDAGAVRLSDGGRRGVVVGVSDVSAIDVNFSASVSLRRRAEAEVCGTLNSSMTSYLR
jgi:hypothetical protein